MEFTKEKQGNTTIYQLKGRLIGEKDGMTLTAAVSEDTGDTATNLVFDLTDLEHINSTGLGVLVTSLTKARKSGGELVLVNPSDAVGNLLLITKLNTIFKVYRQLENALKSFS